MAFRLRYKEHDLELSPGRYVIGRSASCQLSLDDPLVSRQHALLVVGPQGVQIQDLCSRNGVTVNDARVTGTVEIEPGSVIRIGSQEMCLVSVTRAPRQTAATAPGVRTERNPTLGVLGGLTEKALALGHAAEAERLAEPLLHDVLEQARAGRAPVPDTLDKVTNLAVGLASATGKGRWVDFLVSLYRALGLPLSATVIDQLHDVLRKVERVDLALLRDYAAELRERAAGMGPAERFLVNRIQGLERRAAVR